MAYKEQETGGAMKQLAILFLSACVLATVTRAQAPEAAGGASRASLQVETTKSIDAKKAKAGDEVTAVLTQDVLQHGKIVLPRGSKVKGHISEAIPHTKENPESRLGLVFDKVIAKGGREMECPCTVGAIGPPMPHELPSTQITSAGVPQTMPQTVPSTNTRRGRATGAVIAQQPIRVGSVAVPDSASTSTTTSTSQTAEAPNGALSSGSRGVIGLEGMRLSPSAASGTRECVVSSEKKNVKLESGTQLVLLISEESKK
jgi:hypothetical protein